MSVTLDVSRPERSTDVIDSQNAKASRTVVTEETSRPVRSAAGSEAQW